MYGGSWGYGVRAYSLSFFGWRGYWADNAPFRWAGGASFFINDWAIRLEEARCEFQGVQKKRRAKVLHLSAILDTENYQALINVKVKFWSSQASTHQISVYSIGL